MENKKRLMDADEFLGKLQKLAELLKQGKISEIDINLLIASTPIVDAKEVVHGRWVNPYINRYGHPCHCCSVCGFKASHQDKNYCPNCGVKMDGGIENDL